MASSQDLDPDSWQRLPDDVQDLVLLRLPLESIFRFRAVCKRWSNYFSSPSFRASCQHSSLQNPLLLALRIRSVEDLHQAPVLNSHGKKWQDLDLSFLHRALRSQYCFHISGINSDGGLLCVSALNIISRSVIIVCNPLTQTWKVLPPIDIPRNVIFRQVVVRVEQPSGHYRIFIFGGKLRSEDHDYLYYDPQPVFLYNSRSDSVVLLPWVTDNPRGTYGAFHEQFFFTISADHELIAINTESPNWTQTNTGIKIRDQADGYKILVHDGRIFCAIAIAGNRDDKVVEFQIYKLNLATRQFVRLNTKFQGSFAGSSVEPPCDWDFVVHRNCLLVVAYDPRNRTWLEVFESSQPFPSLASVLCSPCEMEQFEGTLAARSLMLSTLRLDLNQQVEFA